MSFYTLFRVDVRLLARINITACLNTKITFYVTCIPEIKKAKIGFVIPYPEYTGALLFMTFSGNQVTHSCMSMIGGCKNAKLAVIYSA